MGNSSLMERAAKALGSGKLYNQFKPEEWEQLRYDWRAWARGNQLPPAGDWLVWLIVAGRGFGKALAIDTPILTSKGWRIMGSLKVGDKVFDEQGQICCVRYITPIMSGHTCYQVEFSDGSVIIADAEHLWLTDTHSSRKSKGRATNPQRHSCTITTEQIKASLYCDKRGSANHSVDCSKPLHYPQRRLPIDPYTLGAWLGDGSSRDAEITCSSPEILNWIRAAGYEVRPERLSHGKAARFMIGLIECPHGQGKNAVHTFQAELKVLGLLKNKHIPAIYLQASINQRQALLQGLMDTDGHATPSGHCEYTSVNKRLADDVLELCIGLGFKAVLSTGRAKLYGKDCGEKYRIHFTPYEPVFRLTRKLNRLHIKGKQAERQSRRYIVGMREVPSVPVRCVQVDSPNHLYLAGKALIPTHNTRAAAEYIRKEVEGNRTQYIALVAKTPADARDIMIEGESGILSISPSNFRPEYEPSKRRITWPNGAKALIYSSQEPDQLRGPQFDLAWADEIRTWYYPQETWDNLMFSLRIGQHPRVVATTTPLPIALIKKLLKSPNVVVTRGTTYENRANLAPSFYSQIISRYEGTRLGRQEIHAELLEDVPGALWKRENIKYKPAPDLIRVVIAIDPAVTSSEGADETGIVGAGIGVDGLCYVITDRSARLSPDGWARRAIQAYGDFKGDKVIGEVNNGGEMVELTLRTIDKNIPYKAVHASRGKVVRAEPIAALYEQGKVFHTEQFEALEDQLCTWTPETGKSPDRLDALVWAITELMLETSKPFMIA